MDSKPTIDPKHREALESFARARASRRQVLHGAAGLAALGIAGHSRPVAARGAAPSLSPAAISAAQRALRQNADSAQAAVDAANGLDPKPAELNIVYEENLQAQDPLLFTGPLWEERTGIKINVITKPFIELFATQVAEHLGATGAYDVITFPPSWTADFVAQGIAEPLDPYIEQYMATADLDDYHPLYKALMNYGGQRYGLFDDGDTIILYYRTDLFEDPANKDAFMAQYGHELAAPKDWTEYDEIQAFFAEQLNWVPETQVKGKVGYSVMPMGHSLHNAGFSLAVSADSQNKEAAYLFIQWLTSPTISLQRVMLPYALRDPYRLSHYSSPEYRDRWPNAGAYLDTLQAAADGALLDIIMPGSAEYHTAIDQAVTSAQSGTAVDEALLTGNTAFNEIT